ncbi:hypothetical protein [Caldithrix abyssi]
MKRFLFIFALFLLTFCKTQNQLHPTSDDGSWFVLKKDDLTAGTHHTRHAEIFGKYVSGYNLYVLKAIDIVQAHAPDGGGYFAGLKADPPESPIGYELKLFGKSLITPPRPTSYCSGSTYAAFIEALNLIFAGRTPKLSEDRFEAARMQEPDGGRREDHIKLWGKWNADGYGNHFALVQYTKMGVRIKPNQARPGDFMNISWENGGGHSVIFLGWYLDENQTPNVVYWSSQKRTNGMGDEVVPISRIKEVCVVRLTNPQNILHFNIEQPVDINITGDKINWQPDEVFAH